MNKLKAVIAPITDWLRKHMVFLVFAIAAAITAAASAYLSLCPVYEGLSARLIAIAGGFLAVALLLQAMKRADAAKNANVQKTFSDAITHLGHERESVILIGLYSLLDLAEENKDYRLKVFNLLCAHIQITTKAEEYQKKHPKQPSTIIQKLLTLLFISEEYRFFTDDSAEKKYRADLSGAYLVVSDLRKARLRGANLSGANLQKAKLENADLRGADLTEANLWEADLTEANLWGADLRRAHFRKEAKLEGANLQEANLQEVDLLKAHLEEADLRGANLRGVNLQEAHLGKAKLQDANLREGSHANLLEAAAIEVAKLQGADLPKADLRRAKLKWANLRQANLWKADLRGADLQEADLKGADLKGADLRGANLQEALFQNACLENTQMQGANLHKAHLPNKTQMGDSDLRGISSYEPEIPIKTFEDRIMSRKNEESELDEDKGKEGVSFQKDEEGKTSENRGSGLVKIPSEKAKEVKTGSYTEEEALQWIKEYKEKP